MWFRMQSNDSARPRSSRGLSRLTACVWVSGVVVSLAGCGDPQSPDGQPLPDNPTPSQVARVPTEPNIIQVITSYRNPPWLYTTDKSRVCGIHVAGLYLSGPDGKGVFGDGIIRPKLYVLERGEDGRKTPRLVHEWKFDVHDAIPYRGKRRRLQGWGYGFPLHWGELDLAGKEIRLVVEFERSDGQVIASGKKDDVVPAGIY